MIYILASASVITALVLVLMLSRRWREFKNGHRVIPAEEEDVFLQRILNIFFDEKKLEKKYKKWLRTGKKNIAHYSSRLKKSRLVEYLKKRLKRFLGRGKDIPQKETTSLFLKSIAEHKKKMRAEE